MQTPEDSPNRCPKCQAPIPEGAPAGLCPKCLMAEVAAGTAPGSPPADFPSVDEVAAGFPDLEIVGVIGHGGMGVVFKVRQPRLERFAALKILPPRLAAQPDFAQRFIREARALARLGHPNIVGVYDFGEAGGFYYLLMEYIDGVNLREALRLERFKPEQALAVVPKLCEALQYAHDEGVLHRDIKPENILLDAKGRVKLADFGIAKLAGEAEAMTAITGTGATLGTPAYMAPEQIEKPGAVDHRADIYSLGVVFYEMLTGELPLGRFAPPSKKTPLDARIDDIVLRALEKERDLRQQSATEMRTELEDVASHPGAAPVADGEWQVRCLTCGRTQGLKDIGGVRIGAASIGKRILVHCSECNGLRFAAVERAGSTPPPPHYVSGPMPGRIRGMPRATAIFLTLGLCSGLMIPVLMALGVRGSWFNAVTCAAVVCLFGIAAMISGVIAALRAPDTDEPRTASGHPAWGPWRICMVVALFSVPIGILATMLVLPMVQRVGSPMIFGFLPLLIVPAVVFGMSALVAASYRSLRRRGAPSWLAVLVCIALLLLLGGGTIVAMLGASWVAYQSAAAIPPAQQKIKASITELARLSGSEDPGDRVSAVDIESTPGCALEGRFFIQRGEIVRELPELEFEVHSDPAWGGWKARLKVTADSFNTPTRFHRAVINLKQEASRGYEGAELAPWPPGANWRPIRAARRGTLMSGESTEWELFQTESTGLAAGEPPNPAPAKLVLRITAHPIPPMTKLQPFTFSISGPRWWTDLGLPEPENRRKSSVAIRLDTDGRILLEGQPFTAMQLRERFAQIGLGKGTEVTLHANSEAPAATVASAVAALEEIGGEVRVDSEPNPEPSLEEQAPVGKP